MPESTDTAPLRAKTKKLLKNARGETCPAGSDVMVWGPEGKPSYLVELRVEDDSLEGGARYEFFEADEADLEFLS